DRPPRPRVMHRGSRLRLHRLVLRMRGQPVTTIAGGTKIEWADLRVPEPMARLAQRDAVVDVVAQFRVIREPLQVVSVQVAASSVAAVLARKAVTDEDVVAPALVFGAEALAATLRHPAVFEGVAG